MHTYSDKNRETDPYALPDVEVFHIPDDYDPEPENGEEDPEDLYEPGYYYWFCFPGCLPDSEPIGPFETEAEAEADAQDQT